jgi:hypothetical protein
MSTAFPQPSKLFAAISALVIAANLFFISACIATSIVDPSFFTIFGVLFIIPLCVLLAAQQYRGAFRRNPSAAKATSILFYIIAGFLLFAIASTVSEAVYEQTSLRLMTWFLVPILGSALISIVFGKMNAVWSSKLREAIASGAVPPVQRGFSLRELLLGVGVIAAMTGITLHFVRSTPPSYAEGVDASAAPCHLPIGATDVSYRKGGRGTITYEFTIDESAFRQWVNSGIGSIEAQSAGIPLREITTPIAIPRYSGGDITINAGLYYSWWKEDRGVHAAFDRTSGRAYFDAHYH